MSGFDYVRMFRLCVIGWCNGFCLPLECVLRPHFGTRYFAAPAVIWAWFLVQCFTLFAAMVRVYHHLAPGVAEVSEPIDMYNLAQWFNILLLIHAIRCWRRVVDMDREEDSQWEGPGWFLLRLLPKGRSWGVKRILYEPGLAVLASVLAYRAGELTGTAFFYLGLASASLAVKNVMVYWNGWEYVRIGRDAQARRVVISRLTTHKDEAPERIGGVVIDSIRHLNADAQRAVLERAGLTPELDELISKK